jgi:hypothetical protein
MSGLAICSFKFESDRVKVSWVAKCLMFGNFLILQVTQETHIINDLVLRKHKIFNGQSTVSLLQSLISLSFQEDTMNGCLILLLLLINVSDGGQHPH